jgi:hypothetical protein
MGTRKIIEIQSGISNIDSLFELAEIVNSPIHEFFADAVKTLFPQNCSVKVVRGPIKRPSRAIEYDVHVQTMFFVLFFEMLVLPLSLSQTPLLGKCIGFTGEMFLSLRMLCVARLYSRIFPK